MFPACLAPIAADSEIHQHRRARRPTLARAASFLCPALAGNFGFLCLLGSGTSIARAATYVWDGGGANDNWSTAANWDLNGAPPSDGTADLQFAGSTRLTPNAQSAYSIHSLGFNSGAGAFTLGGSQLTLGSGGIIQNSTATETVNNAIVLGAAQTWSVNAGALNLGTTATINNGGNLLTVNTAGSTSATFAGSISGAGGLTKTGAGTLTLNASSSYAGGTTISAGTIQFGNPGAFGSGTITLGDANTGASNTTLLATQSMNPFTSAGNGVFQTSFANNVVVSANGTGTATIGTTTFNGQSPNAYNGTIFSGTFQLNRPTTFQSGNGDYTLVSGVISGNVGTLTITGGRRFEIGDVNVVNTFTGNIQITGSGTVLQLNGNLATNAVPDSSNIDVGAGTVLKLAKNGSGDVNVNESINALTGSGTVQIHEAVGNAHTLTVGAGNGSGTFSGVIQNGGGVLSIAKSGTGTQTLSGANSYTGTTTVSGGTLAIDNANTTTARLVDTSGITVNNGGTLLLAQSGATASTDRLNNNAGVTLAGGGKFQTGGLSEGTRPTAPTGGTNGSAGMGALTLSSTTSTLHASIDFGSGANGSSLVFASLSGSGGYLDVLNWSGTAHTDNGAAGNDRLLFAISPSGQDLSHFAFYNDSGSLIGTGGMAISYGNEYEIVPVPEPTTWLAGFLALGTLGYSQRRRLAILIAAWRAGRRPA